MFQRCFALLFFSKIKVTRYWKSFLKCRFNEGQYAHILKMQSDMTKIAMLKEPLLYAITLFSSKISRNIGFGAKKKGLFLRNKVAAHNKITFLKRSKCVYSSRKPYNPWATLSDCMASLKNKHYFTSFKYIIIIRLSNP